MFFFKIAVYVLWFGYNIKEVIDVRRLYYQFILQEVYYELDFFQVKNKFLINIMDNRSCVQDFVF